MDSYQQGYLAGVEGAYTDIYKTMDDDSHPKTCGGNCRPCGVIRTALETGMGRLAQKMTDSEKVALGRTLRRINRS